MIYQTTTCQSRYCLFNGKDTTINREVAQSAERSSKAKNSDTSGNMQTEKTKLRNGSARSFSNRTDRDRTGFTLIRSNLLFINYIQSHIFPKQFVTIQFFVYRQLSFDLIVVDKKIYTDTLFIIFLQKFGKKSDNHEKIPINLDNCGERDYHFIVRRVENRCEQKNSGGKRRMRNIGARSARKTGLRNGVQP